jgi:multiple sugar transport system ATP-binding protein
MNLVSARLDQSDGRFWVSLNSDALLLPESVHRQRPRLQQYVGRDVVVGIRPEDMEDTALANAQEKREGEILHGAILHGVADLVEAMGSDVLVHFPVDVPPVVTDDTRELAQDAGTDDLPKAGAKGTVLVGRFSPRSRIYEGQPVAAWVDTSRLHFFDPATGSSIWK